MMAAGTLSGRRAWGFVLPAVVPRLRASLSVVAQRFPVLAADVEELVARLATLPAQAGEGRAG